MEVHHHPDVHHKKFKDFLLEFLMIFLAVTLGFIAENIRESISNHETEKHYVESLINNLADDTAYMKMVIKSNTMKRDSLVELVRLSTADFSKPENRKKLYENAGMVGYYSLFKVNDATISQLKTSGLQLIKRDHVADSVASYDVRTKIIYASENLYTNATGNAMAAGQQLLDLAATYDTSYYDSITGFKPVMLPLYIENPASLPRFFNKINYEIGATQNYISNIQQVLPVAERLIAYLKNEYDLE